MRLKDRVSLITGAGSGIGQATALRFASEGAIVVIADRNLEAAEKTQHLIEQSGGTGHAIALDVTQEQQVAEAISTTVQQFGRLDVLHNNAGISILKPITETTEADWDQLFNVNLKGVFFGCKHAIPIMVQQGGGVIINTASELAIVGQPLYTAYCATKGGVLAFTRALSVEWAAKGIRINAVCPGPVQTPMLQAEFDLASNPTAEAIATIQSIPVGRLGAPDDIARVALFLASDDAVFVHGAAIVADGGRTTV
ncbi:MAG: SDR family NAD(P)-dependent oxidoreductase [Oculatellaceae cyanobacterium bins.114]|nr:SDR family NAD(P)-dependent oxidoreductase [Oculatellaceae cyanobacterium bins.114]